MPHLSPIPVPAAAYLGWDMQFSRITKFAGPRISRLALTLAQEAFNRGLVARIQHRLYDDRTTTNVVVMAPTGAAVAVLTFVLNDGWVLVGQPGALSEIDADILRHPRVGERSGGYQGYKK